MIFQNGIDINTLITIKSTVLEETEDYTICAFTAKSFANDGGWSNSLQQMGFTASSGEFTFLGSPGLMKSYCKTVSVPDSYIPPPLVSSTPSLVPSIVPSSMPSLVLSSVPSSIPSATIQLHYFMLFKPEIANKVLSTKECFSENNSFSKRQLEIAEFDPNSDRQKWYLSNYNDSTQTGTLNNLACLGESATIGGATCGNKIASSTQNSVNIDMHKQWKFQSSQLSTAAQDPINVAAGKTTSQSSTYSDSYDNLAVDSVIAGSSGTETLPSDNPWWKVELGEIFSIDEITIFNRSASPEQLSGFVVEVHFQSIIVWTHTSNPAEIPPPESNLSLPANIFGDMVKIRLPGSSKILSLAEVQVFTRYSQSENVYIISPHCPGEIFDVDRPIQNGANVRTKGMSRHAMYLYYYILQVDTLIVRALFCNATFETLLRQMIVGSYLVAVIFETFSHGSDHDQKRCNNATYYYYVDV